METQSWLIRNDSDRERMLDMDQRLRPVRVRTFAVLGVALFISAFWVGWWTFAPLLIALGLFRLLDPMIERSERAEYWMFGAWVGSEVIIAASVALTGSSSLSMLSLLAIPIVTLSARFSDRGIQVGVAAAALLVVLVAFGTNPQEVLHDPPLLICPLAVVIAIAMLSGPLMRSDLEHRSKAVLDQLTGLLNRTALSARAFELEQQSAITGEPVAMIIGDLDHFKEVNDSEGHPVGDLVLQEVAYRMRKRLRAYPSAYRIGGDEILVLMPGADLEGACALAEDLRGCIASEPIAGVQVTMSFGVAGSPDGSGFAYDSIFARADRALYRAMNDGRNCVRSDPVLTLIAS